MKRITDLLEKNLNIYSIRIEDLTQKHSAHNTYDGGMHIKLTIISDDFNKMPLIERHKKIYTILQDMIKKEIHALSIVAKTINEYHN